MDMATATIPKPEQPLGPVSDMPDTRAAQDRLNTLRTTRVAVEADVIRGRSEEDYLRRSEAAVEEPGRLLKILKLDADIVRARIAVDEARESDVAAISAQLEPMIREQFAREVAAASQHVVENEKLIALYQRFHELTGRPINPFHCANATRGNLDDRIARARAEGLID
jgi:hypothetical protein